MTVLDSTFINS